MSAEAPSLTFEAGDGAILYVHHWPLESEAKAVIQIAHGMAEHGARYGRLAAALTLDYLLLKAQRMAVTKTEFVVYRKAA